MIVNPLPQYIAIGPLNFYFYGLILGLASLIVLVHVTNTFGDKVKILDYLLVIVSMLFGARFLFILHNLDLFFNDITIFIRVWDGGLALFGALIGLILSTLYVSKKRRLKFLNVTDSIALYLPLAQALGRWGNFINNELYGRPTELPWRLYIPVEDRLHGYGGFEYFHPTFLYESILNLCSFGVLFFISKRWKLQYGMVSFVYLINYGFIRLITNRFRIDKEFFDFYVVSIESSDFFAGLAVLVGVVGLVWVRQGSVSPKLVKQV